VDAATIVVSVTGLAIAVLAVPLIGSFRRALSLTDPATLRAVAAGRAVPEQPEGLTTGALPVANSVIGHRRAVDFGPDAGLDPDPHSHLSTRLTQ
jgi:hypothetical protein